VLLGKFPLENIGSNLNPLSTSFPKSKMDDTETILDFLKKCTDIKRFTDKFPHFSESKWTQSIPPRLEISNELLGEKNYLIL
jgi:hypothetical protein